MLSRTDTLLSTYMPPHRSELEQFLNISVTGDTVSIPAVDVGGVQDAGRVSILPFAARGLEGLADVQGRPVPQLDLALLLHGKPGQGSRIATFTRHGRELAVRGDAFSIAAEAHGADIGKLLQGDFSSLPTAADTGLPPRPPPGNPRNDASGPAVLSLKAVAGGNAMTIAITGHEAVEEVAEWRPTSPGSAEGVARVGQRLYPGRRLRSPEAPDDGAVGPGQWAILVPYQDGNRYALVVDKVVSLEALPRSHLFNVGRTGSQQGTWFAGDGPMTQVFHVSALIDGEAGSGFLDGLPGPGDRENLAGMALGTLATRLQFEGIRFSCGTIECVIPFGIARWAISLGAEVELSSRASTGASVPVLDAAALLGRPTPATLRQCVLLSLPQQKLVAVRVDKLRLEPHADGNEWLPLPSTSIILSALFDAVRLDAGTGAWLLRVRADIAPERLPRAARVAIGRAIAGWTSEAVVRTDALV